MTSPTCSAPWGSPRHPFAYSNMSPGGRRSEVLDPDDVGYLASRFEADFARFGYST